MTSKSSLMGLVVLGALLGVAGVASATRVDFTVFENQSGYSTAGLDLWVDVLDVGGTKVDFVFHNDSTVDSIIGRIFFESPLATILDNGGIQAQSAGVSMVYSEPGGNLPGGNNIAWVAAFADANKSGSVSNGINNGGTETLTIRFDYINGANVNSVLNMLVSSSGRIGEHIQSIGPQSVSMAAVTTGTPVPLPAAVWSGMALIGAIGAYRARRRVG